jgi:hypothetical protein
LTFVGDAHHRGDKRSPFVAVGRSPTGERIVVSEPASPAIVAETAEQEDHEDDDQ